MKKILFLNLISSIILLVSQKVLCNNVEHKLLFDLFQGYTSIIRPTISHRIPVNVSFSLNLLKVIDVVSNYLQRFISI